MPIQGAKSNKWFSRASGLSLMLRRQRQIHAQIHKLVDAGLFSLAFYLAHLIRFHVPLEVFGGTPEIHSFSRYVWLLLIIFPLSPLCLELQGFYNRPLLASRKQTVWQLFKACVVVTIAVILVMFLAKEQLARSVIILFGGTSFCLVLAKEEFLRRSLQTRFGQEQFKRRVVLAGTEEDMSKLEKELRAASHGGIEIVGRVDINQTPVDHLVELLHEKSPNGVILSARHIYFGQLEKAIQACELEGVEVWLLADFFNTQISKTSVDDFYGHPMLVFRSAPELSWQGVAKQALDFMGALALLIGLSPLLLGVALTIKWTSPGPILFRQLRSGLNGKPFTMLKFRSMVTNAEQRKHELEMMNEMSGPVFKVTRDPRVTPIGRWIRRYSIDELPQLWNVLRGEMSLVGPRPLPVDETRRFDDLAHRRRLSVKPGLTCLWQVSGRNDVTDFKDWVRLDLEYIDNWSIWLDFKILFRTIPAVFNGVGAK